jgi:tRNA/rRNA methyltransferase
MAGTNHGQEESWQGPSPVFVLVEPQMGENIGAAARAMWNFGLDRMRLVAPRDGWPNEKAVAMASGAGRVLDQVGLFESSAEALGDVNYVFATTARPRDLTKDVVTPEEAMRQARNRIADGQSVGVLFGPERAGLENDVIARANAIVSVPVNPAFASLNLAQCVLLLAYEWRRQGTDREVAGDDRADLEHVERLYDAVVGRLQKSGFFFPAGKEDSMKLNLRNLFSRMPLTEPDIRILHGVIKSLAEKSPRD